MNYFFERGFLMRSGNLYYASDKLSPVDIVRMVAAMPPIFPWLKSAVTEFKLIRMDEAHDLTKAL